VTTATSRPLPAPPEAPREEARPRRPLRWWRELVYAGLFYLVYSLIRDIHGERPVSVEQAFHNATRVITVERWVGLFQESRIQSWFLGWHWFLRFWDEFYGSAHFVVTIAVLVWLFFRQRDRYPLLRNALAFTTALALIGFAFFPLMPPRLLPSPYHFVDTLRTVGGLWSFESGPVSAVSNQYAAMPSLHCAWALWCAIAVAPAIRNRALRLLVILYPIATLFCIVVTGNHFFLDALGGAACLAVGYGLAWLLRSLGAARAQRAALGSSG
jgi:hypothetical protein